MVSNTAIVEFEVYVLMTMKLRIRMSHEEAELESKLAERGLSVDEAERIYERLAETLGDAASYVENMKKCWALRTAI